MDDIFAQLEKIGARTAKALDAFMNDKEMYLKYVREFPDEPSMGKLAAAMECKDYDAAEKAVHAMKGIVQGLAFTQLADAAADMLDELRTGDTATATEEYDNVKALYKRYCDVICAWREAN